MKNKIYAIRNPIWLADKFIKLGSRKPRSL